MLNPLKHGFGHAILKGHWKCPKEAAVKFASMWNMVGMLLLSFCSDEYQCVRDQIHIPFVVYGGYLEGIDRFCNIRIDDRDGGRQLGAHLRELGHCCVLCVADNLECMDRERYEGLCEGLGVRADFLKIPMQKTERTAFSDDGSSDDGVPDIGSSNGGSWLTGAAQMTYSLLPNLPSFPMVWLRWMYPAFSNSTTPARMESFPSLQMQERPERV